MQLNKQESMKRINSLIKGWMLELESAPGWKILHPNMISLIRRAVTRIAWGSYKVGVLTKEGSDGILYRTDAHKSDNFGG